MAGARTRRHGRVPSEARKSALARALWAVLHFLASPALLESDTDDEYMRKLVVVMGNWWTIVGNSIAFVVTLQMRGWDTTLQFMVIASVITNAGAYVHLINVKHVSNKLLAFLVVGWTILISQLDLHHASSYQARMWPFFVLVIDLLLICNTSTVVTGRYVCYVVFWIALTSAESGFRFGLYDMPGLAPMEQRLEMITCDKPPCKLRSWLQGFNASIAVFLMDFFMTRSFAVQLRQQKAALEDSVTVAGRIAEHLAAYDLDSAEADLRQHAEQLPPDMATVLGNLLRNLKSYRPFLPDALFRDDQDRQGRDGFKPERDVPRARTEVISIVSDVSSLSSNTLPPPQSPTLGFAVSRPTSLDVKKLTLLGVRLKDCSQGLEDMAGSYVVQHANSLSMVFDAVKRQRGSLDYFHGDRIYASFNAFGASVNHSIEALTTVQSVANNGTAARFSIVTGEAYAGYLGTAAVRSPSIVGVLPELLEDSLHAAGMVDEDVVCCRVTARAAMFRHPLRLLLHRFWFASGDSSPTALYTLHFREAVSHGGSQPLEWMYEVEDNGSLLCGIYNDAATVHHLKGAAAAMEHLQQVTTDVNVVEEFRNYSKHAMFIDLRPRCSVLAETVAEVLKVNAVDEDVVDNVGLQQSSALR